ncbi:MAG TPA: crossover junction endodeoxyribonuclease RuvC, partial [Bacteroidales bacterium]|nr:crossover junction endodeoxyribonuclease RuvC [Bacteroidales bacterium]
MKCETDKIILGIDPGTNYMGYGVIQIVGNTASLVSLGI